MVESNNTGESAANAEDLAQDMNQKLVLAADTNGEETKEEAKETIELTDQ